jgi:hypothetical protein
MGGFLSSFMKSLPRIHIHLQYRRTDEIYRLLSKEVIGIGMVAFSEKRTNIYPFYFKMQISAIRDIKLTRPIALLQRKKHKPI